MNIFYRLGTWLFARTKGRRRPSRVQLELELLEDRLTPATGTSNAIIAENLLPGNPQSEWDVGGSGDQTIQGFATSMSVNHGETIQFKINDPSLASYHIDIYRIGYYDGMGARKVATIGTAQTTEQNQPSPLFDPTSRLVDAGNWAVSASWAVPVTAVSGVYIAKLTRDDTGGASQIIFVVRDDTGQADVLFQTSDATWQAYNSWGGWSLYGGPDAQRATAVSYNRPFNTRYTTVNGRDFFFGEEYAMVRFLEANGYDVSYSSEIDTARNGSELLEHKVFMSTGHDEYWSAEQVANVTAARDAGVNLAFFSANEVYWKTRWANSTDASATAFRTMITYKDSLNNADLDPSDQWTGLWRDMRFTTEPGVKPENSLTGTIFTVNRGPGGETGTSMNVPYEYANLRFWRNTSVASLTAGQTAVLGDQVLGYEWDEDLDNGYRPAGLIDMSSTTQTVPEKIDAYGNATAIGTATHSLTMYRASSGALVFGAGTVQWSWGLDGVHDGPATTPNQAMRQATVNLFADMGVQPSTLQAGLQNAFQSTDGVAPITTITSLTNGQQVNAGTPITISGTATDAGGVVAAVEVSVDGGLTWHRATGHENWSYTWNPTKLGPVVIRTRASDDSLNLESPAAGLTITVKSASSTTTGLVASYNFDQGTGTNLPDASGNNNTGTISGATWSSSGIFGGALSFNGTSDIVNIADANSLDLTTGMTLEAWVRPSGLSDFSNVILKEQSGSLVYALYAADGPNNPSSGYIKTTSEIGTVGSFTLPLNTWSHLATTYDGSVLRLFVNGVQVSSRNVTGNITTSTGALRIGGNNVWGEFFKGLIDNVRVYNRALSVTEIGADMSTPIGGVIDSTAPTASITSPSNNGTVAGIVNVVVSATDNVGVAGVQFLLNGQMLGSEDVNAPFTLNWDTTKVANGTYTLSAWVRDVAGNFTTTAGVNVTVANAADILAPTVTITNPSANQRLAGTTVTQIFAADNIGVVNVKLKLNNTVIGSQTSGPYGIVWNTSAWADGVYTLVAEAQDAAGNVTSSDPVSIVIDNTAPTIVAVTPTAGDLLVNSNTSVAVTFNEDILPNSAVFQLRNAANNLVSATTTYNSATHVLTLNPSQDLNLGASYTVSLLGVRDVAGNLLTGTTTWIFATDSRVVNATIWDSTETPVVQSANDTSAVELGVKFKSDATGYITGVRFYKGTANTGTHVGHLWDANGNLLATVTFTNETASGWQQANFSTPVAITANATYVVSYYAPNGGYSVSDSYFATAGKDNSRLHAFQSTATSGNGVYRYGVGGGFPTGSFKSSNYWVDAVFSNVLGDITGPVIQSRTPAPDATQVAANGNITATFDESAQSSTIVFQLRDASNALVAATVTYDDASRTVTLAPTAALAENTTYTVTLSGAKDSLGNVMTESSWSFTTSAPDHVAPTVVTKTPLVDATGVAPATVVTATFNESINPTTIALKMVDDHDHDIPTVMSYNDVTKTVSIKPLPPNGLPAGCCGTCAHCPLATSTTYTVEISGVQDLAGNTMTTTSWSFTTDVAILNRSLWDTAATPAIASGNDLMAIEVGTAFQSSKTGYITGMEFYKGASNTGAHIGHLWDASGNLLATGTFDNETASGWQPVTFASPVIIQANTKYVISYYSPGGGYAATVNYFTSAYTNGPLSVSAGNGGVYRYGSGGGFPTQSYGSSNYWVDAIFSNTITDMTPPTLTARSPIAGAGGVAVNTTVTATFSEDVSATSIVFELRNASNTLVSGAVSYNSTTRTATFTPDAMLAAGSYTAKVSGAKDAAGNVMSQDTWSFSTGTVITATSLWTDAALPNELSAADTSAVELGFKFQADISGYISSIRFYKGAANTGTHVGHLWDANGNLLATATFTNESASGWQQVNLSIPVAISANTTYVVSYYAPTGGYSTTHAGFTNTVANGPLRGLASGDSGGNGLYRYGTGGGFPTQSYASSNYWVDVVFVNAIDDLTAPTVTAKTPAPNATNAAMGGNITATFSEQVQLSTIQFELRDSNNNLVSGVVTYDQATKTATFNPNNYLGALKTYTAKLSGAKDAAGNAMTAVTWSFTTIGTWTQSTAADFNSGTANGITVSSENGVELRLSSNLQDEFGGSSLGSSWGSTSWTSQGGAATSISTSSGELSLAGGMVSSASTFVGKGVEASINFSAAPYQHFGIATSLSTIAGNSWALFSTGGTTSELYARVDANGFTQDVHIGSLPGGYHTYKILPTATGFEFYLDGDLKASIAQTFPANTAVHVVFSSFTSAPLKADWVHLTDYSSSGTYTSSVYDAGQSVNWQMVSWTATAPAGTSVKVEIMLSDDNTNWSSWAEVANTTELSGARGRYIRYRVTLTSTDSTLTPVFKDITFTFA